ncbi:alpha/beta-hydrolase [Clavulina sp. PMI_390]|nr:alpha/beta-hydrolase [Clavulina sp. PMI_390]
MPHLVLLALLVIPVGLYLLLAGLVFCFQDKILYPAFLVPGLETSLKRNPAWHATFLRSGTRYRIRCVIGICSSEKARNVTALIFHSNALTCLGPDMEQYARYFFRKGCHVVIPTHRGYGTSEGSPSQKALLEDAQAAIDYCMDHWTLRGTKLLIFGWSMGGAVACHIAAKNPNATNALIILNTWDTFKHVQQYFWPARPFPLSFRDKWDNLEAIKSLGPNTSILILNSRDDGIVPPDSSVQNLLAARSRPVNPATVNHSMLTFGDHGMSHLIPH